jgi:hypothetical protein
MFPEFLESIRRRDDGVVVEVSKAWESFNHVAAQSKPCHVCWQAAMLV